MCIFGTQGIAYIWFTVNALLNHLYGTYLFFSHICRNIRHMNNTIKQIREIAHELKESNSTFSRADLAYELNLKDSVEIERLVSEAYVKFNHDKAINDSFITNDGSMTLVKAYLISSSLDNEEHDKVIATFQKDLRITDEQIHILESIVGNALSNSSNKKDAGFLDYISGSAGIKNVKGEASILFEKYSQLADSYIESKTCVNNNIADFVDIRSNIMTIFQKYSLALVDIFGDSIKIIDPKLFDFSSIQYHDVSAMLKRVELEYNQIADKCPILLEEIYDSFKDNFSNSLRTLSSTNTQNNKLALINAGLSFLNHYFDASQKTNMLRQDLSNFKISVSKDVATIKGDMSRLLVIHKTLNDLYIPKASIFYRNCNNIFNSELQSIIELVYQSPKCKELKSKRDEILAENEMLLREINDHKESLSLYESIIKETSDQLNAQRPNYDCAMAVKPKKPFLCIGPMKSRYYRALSDWDYYYAPLIDNYNKMLIDLELSQKERTTHSEELQIATRKQKEHTIALNKISGEIKKHISTNNAAKAKVLKHLKQIIGLLNLAKEITESKLDSRLLSTFNIKEANSLVLSPETENKINTFTNDLSKQLKVSTLDIDTELCDEEKEIISGNINHSIEKGAAALNTMLKLQEQIEHEKISIAEYNKQLHKIQKNFMNEIKSIDKKGEYLREIFRKINTTTDNEELRKALLELSDNQINISENDLDLFLKGKKTITL